MLIVPEIDRLYNFLWKELVETCPHCKGVGRKAIDDGFDIRTEKCVCLQLVNSAVLKANSNLPREFWEADTIKTDAHAFIEEYASNLREHRSQGVGVLFYGDLGRGKTTSAAAILLRVARLNCGRIGYVTASDYIESTVPASSDPELAEYRRELSTADFLVLDELGNEYRKKGSGFALLQLEQLLRARRSQMKPTILCVNFQNAAELKIGLGETIWSLLGGKTKSFVFGSGDKRRA